MLQPVTMVPSAVSSAAPTLNPENGATAYSLAWRAASTRRSESANGVLQQAHEIGGHAARGPHHLGVIERLRQHSGGHVGDARDAEHVDTHVAGDDGFGHRRHADRVGT